MDITIIRIGGETMPKKLSLFYREHIQNKTELLVSLEKYKNHCLEDGQREEGWTPERVQAVVFMVNQMIGAVQKIELPDIDQWWFYSYDFTYFSLELNLCHCEQFSYDAYGNTKSLRVGQTFQLIRIPSVMYSVAEAAQQFDVTKQTVRQWIRKGKLRAVEKKGREWYISSLADRPGRQYWAVTYVIENLSAELEQKFPYLQGQKEVFIRQNMDNPTVYDLFLSDAAYAVTKTMQVSCREREKLEFAFLSAPGISAAEGYVQYIPSKQEEDDEDVDMIYNVRAQEESPLHYGAIIVTKGRMRGRIGYYDGDDGANAIVYFGDFLLADHYHLINCRWISNVISTVAIIDRMNALQQDVYQALTIEKQFAYYQELQFCSSLLNERYVTAMNHLSQERTHQVFISHASQDLMQARALATDLLNAGYTVFLDDWSIGLGENIMSRISTGLEKSNSLIMLISQSYLNSVFCSDEWTSFYTMFSKQKENAIYPLILDDSNPPPLLAAIKYARIRNGEDYQRHLPQLLKALKKQVNT